MFIMRLGPAGLTGEIPGPLDRGSLRGYKHSPTTGRQDLVSVEGKGGEVSERAGTAASRRGAKRLRCVFDDRDAVAVAGRLDRIEICALTVQIDGDDSPGHGAATQRPIVKLRLQQVGIDGPRLR